MGNEAMREAWLEATWEQVPAGARLLNTGVGERRHKEHCGRLNYVAQDFAQYDGQGDRLPQSGFEIVERWPGGNYFHFLVQEFRRPPELGTRYDARRSRSPRPWRCGSPPPSSCASCKPLLTVMPNPTSCFTPGRTSLR